MELGDITGGILLASQAGIANAHQKRADRNAVVARDASVAARIYGAAADAHADGAARLRTMLLASDLNVERLECRVDELTSERSVLIAHIGSLLDELEMLRARAI